MEKLWCWGRLAAGGGQRPLAHEPLLPEGGERLRRDKTKSLPSRQSARLSRRLGGGRLLVFGGAAPGCAVQAHDRRKRMWRQGPFGQNSRMMVEA